MIFVCISSRYAVVAALRCHHVVFDNHLIRYVVYSNGNDGIIDRGQLLFPLCSIDITVLSPCNG